MRDFHRGGNSNYGSSRGGGRSFGGKRDFSRSGPREMHDAVCGNCGKPCQVPFRPTGEKPVYCRDCFAKMNGESPRGDRPSFSRESTPRPQGPTKEDITALNEKLDKILSLLEKPAEK